MTTRGDADTWIAVREGLRDLVADGIDFVPRAERSAKPAAPRAPSGFRPRVAPLAPPAHVGADAAAKAALLEAVRAEIGDCRRCTLCERRTNIVFGEGCPEARVVFVGEGPGEEEDKSGRPFVGRAGELLTKMIEAVGWRREDVYICNIVKCRPPGNRDPQPLEVATCEPFLHQQIRAIAPAAIVTLGKPAISALLGRVVPITKLRGRWQAWQGIEVMPTYHPAYLLRNYTRETRQAVWDDLRAVRERVEGAR
ncbi:MAG TPA: uracil-DNA glycosylase [Myxococcota bacterium]|nr:uracil-DNA glycosylase [Myxococcota bacterium]